MQSTCSSGQRQLTHSYAPPEVGLYLYRHVQKTTQTICTRCFHCWHAVPCIVATAESNGKEGKHCVSALLGYAAERCHHMYMNKVVYFCVQDVRQLPLAGQM